MTVLALEALSRHFGAIRALEGVDLTLAEGEVLGLMGDNGAGKSTLLKLVAGNIRPSSGRILVADSAVQFRRPSDAREYGIEVVHQDLALCDNLTAAANIFLGRELHRRRFGFLPLLDHAAMEATARQLFEELQSETRAEDLVRSMSGGQRQAVAIARTRLSQPRVVLLDEPTAAISVRQVEQVLDLIRRLRDQGVAVVLVSHRMDDVFAVCDRVVVLRRGHKVAELSRSATTAEEITGYITGALVGADD
jgi:simple sugar transport system ATP-binding protein